MEKIWATMEFEDGASFYVDFVGRQLCDFDVPWNSIKLSELEDKGTHYEFYYDKNTRNIGKSLSSDSGDSETIYKVQVGQLVDLHPHAIAAIYGVDLDDLRGRNDAQFFKVLPEIRARQWEQVKATVDLHALDARIKQERLPTVIIGNERFGFNGEKNIFYHSDKSHVLIELAYMQPTPERDGYACFVDVDDCSPVYKNVAGHNPDSLAYLKVPEPEVIDPVGVARRRGFKDTDLLYAYPLVDGREMKIKPLSDRAALTIKNKPSNNISKEQRRKRGQRL
jgi:hypothetical protein